MNTTRLANRASCRQLAIFLISCLPGSSAGWALPAKMIWIGRSRIVEQPVQPVEVGHDQVGPLVGGKAPGEADRQNVGIEQVARRFDHGVALAAAAALPADAAAHERQQQVLQRVVRLPTVRPDRRGECSARLPARPSAAASRPGKLRS